MKKANRKFKRDDIILHNANCLDVLPTIADGSVDAIITDPPYYVGMTHNSMKATFSDLTMLKPFFENLFKEYKRVLKVNGSIYFFTDWRTYPFIHFIIEKIFVIDNLLVWDKHGRPTKTKYGQGYELVLFSGSIKKSYVSNIIKDIKSFNAGAKKTNGEKIHPTQKPIELITKFILDSTEKSDIVLDTFSGSGTTAVASMRTGRKFIGAEINEQYFNAAVERIEQEEK